MASDKQLELDKLRWAVRWGADAVMDLSTGGDLDETREFLIANCTVPIGTVPIYPMVQGRTVEDLTCKDILATIEKQANQGVDFFTIHAGLLQEHLPLAAKRTAGIVRRAAACWPSGCSTTTARTRCTRCSTRSARSAARVRRDATRWATACGPGCLADASDAAQFAELGRWASWCSAPARPACR